MAERHVVLGFVLICFAVSFVFRSWHIATPFGTFVLFCFANFFTSCTPPAARLLFLRIKCFLLSQVSCCPCAPGAPPIAELQETAKQTMSSVQSKMAICHCRVTTVREASNVQCAKQNGDMPPPGNKRLRSTEFPMCKTKWRSATTEQQQSAKQTTSNAQTKIAIRPHRLTTSSMKRFKILCLTRPQIFFS